MKIIHIILAALMLTGAVLTSAGAGEGRVPLPHPAKAAKGKKCVAPIPEMRRFHMNYLKHQRIDTLRKGIRGNPYSLTGCVDCHAVPDKKAGGARTLRPFCQTCHSYAAVKLDCFSCHTGKADGSVKKSALPADHTRLAGDMKAYLKDRSPVK